MAATRSSSCGRGQQARANVLVRGSFSDPETGSYAVKRYVADRRDLTAA